MNGVIRNGSIREITFMNRYIHDEMYSVQLDPSGNYLLLGGSGDEYSYSKSCNGWSSDIWVSYLVVLNTAVSKRLKMICIFYDLNVPQGNTIFEGVFGNTGANNAGEYLGVDNTSGELMVFVDSDTFNGGFGFMKLSPS